MLLQLAAELGGGSVAGRVHDITGFGIIFACSSATRVTYWSTSCLSAPDRRADDFSVM